MTTKIEWCDAVWNPVTGCSHVSEGCRFCYAEREFPRLAGNPKTPTYHGRTFTDVACHPERLSEPLRRKKPTRYFVNSMSDLFHPDVPFEFIAAVFGVMAAAPQHTFIILTKRPERIIDWASWRQVEIRERDWEWEPWRVCENYALEEVESLPSIGCHQPWPLPNVWLGVSVEDQRTADERFPILLQCPAAIRWVSYEPALGPVDFTKHAIQVNGQYPFPTLPEKDRTTWLDLLDWIVAGGESGPNARPSHPNWFRQVRDDCQAAVLPFFFKQHGEFLDCDMTPGAIGTHVVCECGWSDRFHNDNIERHHYGHGCKRQRKVMHRVGKKRAGRLLDGVEWSQFPEVR